MPRGRKPKPRIENTPPVPTTLLEPLEIWRREKVVARVGLTYTTIWLMIKAGEFPPARQIAAKSRGWLSTEVTAWMRSRPVADMSAQAAEL